MYSVLHHIFHSTCNIFCTVYQLHELVIVCLVVFREKETEILKEQIDKLDTQINKEEEKAKDLEVKAR